MLSSFSRVLISDPNEADCKQLRSLLTDSGVKNIFVAVTAVESGVLIRKSAAEKRKIHFLFLSLNEDDASENLIAELMSDENLSEIKIIVTYDDASKPSVTRAMQKGAIANLKKPFVKQDVAALLARNF